MEGKKSRMGNGARPEEAAHAHKGNRELPDIHQDGVSVVFRN